MSYSPPTPLGLTALYAVYIIAALYGTYCASQPRIGSSGPCHVDVSLFGQPSGEGKLQHLDPAGRTSHQRRSLTSCRSAKPSLFRSEGLHLHYLL